jgi:hypothetical protein
MYNLIVTSEKGAWAQKEYSIHISRYNENTTEEIKDEFSVINEKTKEKLMSCPTLFAYEGKCNLPARIGKISKIKKYPLSFDEEPDEIKI